MLDPSSEGGAGELLALPLNIANSFCACSLLMDWRLSKFVGCGVALGTGGRKAFNGGVVATGVVVPGSGELDGISAEIGLGGETTDDAAGAAGAAGEAGAGVAPFGALARRVSRRLFVC
jgi:hypothetical protein